MSPNPHWAARRLAERFKLTPPVTSGRLAIVTSKLGARVTYSTAGDALGCLRQVGGQWVIELSEDVEPHRSLFTHAHELGHLYLRRSGRPYAHAEETWCNEFAAELLAPEQYVREHLRSTPESLVALRALAAATRLSMPAAHLRAQRSARWSSVLFTISKSPAGRWRIDTVSARARLPLHSTRIVDACAAHIESLAFGPHEISLSLSSGGRVIQTDAEAERGKRHGWILAPQLESWRRL